MERTTRDRIVDEALTLFSIYGFHGTSVKKIADAVGIKDSSLYKHFRSKQEIFDTIVIEMQNRMEAETIHTGLPNDDNFREAAKIYERFTLEDLLGLSEQIFLFYLKDDFVSRFWRMANMEQYQNPHIFQIYQKIFLEDSIEYQTKLFAEMIERGAFVDVDPRAMAINFYSPIFLLLSKYNGRPQDEDEAIQVLDAQIREFYRIYRKK